MKNIISSLKNKIAMITGASSGIGEACATAFAEEGAHLVLAARRMDRLNEIKNKIKKLKNQKIHIDFMDVSSNESVNMFFEKIPKELKKIDIVINNAGLALGLDPVHEADINDLETMINTNIKSLLYITRKTIPDMMKRKNGHIINIGSIAGHGIYPGGAVYCATKHAVRALSQGMRADLLGLPIKISLIEPGIVATEFSLVRHKGNSKAAQKTYEGFAPLLPENIAAAAVYCASAPEHVNIDNIVIMPIAQAGLSMVKRNK